MQLLAVEPFFGEGDLSLSRNRDPNHQAGAFPGLRFLPEMIGPAAASGVPFPAEADHHVGLPADFEIHVFEAFVAVQGGAGDPPLEDVRAREELFGHLRLRRAEVGLPGAVFGREEFGPTLRQQHLVPPAQLLATPREHLVGTTGERGNATQQKLIRRQPQLPGKGFQDRLQVGLDRLVDRRSHFRRQTGLGQKGSRPTKPNQNREGQWMRVNSGRLRHRKAPARGQQEKATQGQESHRPGDPALGKTSACGFRCPQGTTGVISEGFQLQTLEDKAIGGTEEHLGSPSARHIILKSAHRPPIGEEGR